MVKIKTNSIFQLKHLFLYSIRQEVLEIDRFWNHIIFCVQYLINQFLFRNSFCLFRKLSLFNFTPRVNHIKSILFLFFINTAWSSNLRIGVKQILLNRFLPSFVLNSLILTVRKTVAYLFHGDLSTVFLTHILQEYTFKLRIVRLSLVIINFVVIDIILLNFFRRKMGNFLIRHRNYFWFSAASLSFLHIQVAIPGFNYLLRC